MYSNTTESNKNKFKNNSYFIDFQFVMLIVKGLDKYWSTL